MEPEIRILLVDDHALFRRGLMALLGQDEEMRVVGEAGDVGEALRIAAQSAPDVVLLDNHLPGVRGVDAVQTLRDAAPAARVLLLTVSDDPADLGAALRNGASGYLLKTCDADELIAAIRRARHGQVVIGAEMAPRLAEAMQMGVPGAASSTPTGSESDELAALTPRERQIAAAISHGASNKQIARDLNIAETTVKVHVQSILRKFELDSRVQIAVWASANNLGA